MILRKNLTRLDAVSLKLTERLIKFPQFRLKIHGNRLVSLDSCAFILFYALSKYTGVFMRCVLWLIFIFHSFQVTAIDESNFDRIYNSSVGPYYNQFPLKFHFYHDNSSKKFPYKFIKKGSKDLFVILPGKGEPLERYAETLYDFKNIDRDILIIQFRGQGYSSRSTRNPEKTYIRKYNDVVSDLHSIFSDLEIRKNYESITLIGHSMGAHFGLRYEQEYNMFDVLILNSPMIGVLDEKDTQKNYLLAKLLIGVGMGKAFIPGGRGWRDYAFEENDITHSLVRYKNFRRINVENPATRLGSVTVRWVYEAIKSERELFKYSQTIMKPILIFQAGKDVVVSNEKQDMYCDNLPNCEMIRVENSMHNFLQETDDYREQYLNILFEKLNLGMRD